MSYISITNHPAIELPLPPQQSDPLDIAIYANFMRHLRNVVNSRAEIKILSSIQFTADIVGTSDAHVAKTLIECGMLAPRNAFPSSFLRHIDQALLKDMGELGAPSKAYLALAEHWHHIGEDPFAGAKHQFPAYSPSNTKEDMRETV